MKIRQIFRLFASRESKPVEKLADKTLLTTDTQVVAKIADSNRLVTGNATVYNSAFQNNSLITGTAKSYGDKNIKETRRLIFSA